MYGHPDAVRHSIRMAIHFFVNFVYFDLTHGQTGLAVLRCKWNREVNVLKMSMRTQLLTEANICAISASMCIN